MFNHHTDLLVATGEQASAKFHSWVRERGYYSRERIDIGEVGEVLPAARPINSTNESDRRHRADFWATPPIFPEGLGEGEPGYGSLWWLPPGG